MESVKTYIRSLNTVVNEMSGSQGVMTQTLQDLSSAIRAGIKG